MPRADPDGGPFGLSWWEWLSGPSVAMMSIITLVVWTTSGTFMLMYLSDLSLKYGFIEEQPNLDELILRD